MTCQTSSIACHRCGVLFFFFPPAGVDTVGPVEGTEDKHTRILTGDMRSLPSSPPPAVSRLTVNDHTIVPTRAAVVLRGRRGLDSRTMNYIFLCHDYVQEMVMPRSPQSRSCEEKALQPGKESYILMMTMARCARGVCVAGSDYELFTTSAISVGGYCSRCQPSSNGLRGKPPATHERRGSASKVLRAGRISFSKPCPSIASLRVLGISHSQIQSRYPSKIIPSSAVTDLTQPTLGWGGARKRCTVTLSSFASSLRLRTAANLHHHATGTFHVAKRKFL